MKLKKVIIKIITIIIMLIIFSNSILGTVIAAPEENETNETNTTENSEDSEETDDSEEEEQVIDVSQMVDIKGDAQNGYYITFKEDLDDKLKQIYEDNKITYRNIGVDNFIETFKKFIKAEIATEYPNMGGVVESSAPISKGNEAPAGGNETVSVTTGGSGEGSYEWPVSTQTTPQDRGQNITSVKADRESPGGIGSTNHQGMDIRM